MYKNKKKPREGLISMGVFKVVEMRGNDIIVFIISHYFLSLLIATVTGFYLFSKTYKFPSFYLWLVYGCYTFSLFILFVYLIYIDYLI